MKHLFAICLLLATQAHAQGICAGISPTGPATLTEAAPEWAALPCIPDTLGGTGKGYGLRVSSAGVVPWVWCPSGTGWAPRWGALTWAEAAPLAAELPAALLAADKRAALAALGDTHMSRDIGDADLKALWCPHWQAMRASMPQAAFVPYIVAPWPGATRRSTYPVVNGLRSTTANGSVSILTGTLPTPVAAPRVTEGATTYCSVPAVPTNVVACKPR